MSISVILSWVLCGLVVGLIARFLVPGPQPVGLLGTILVGVLGAFLGGAIHWMINGPPGEPFSFAANAWQGWLFSILGAFLILFLFARRPRHSWA